MPLCGQEGIEVWDLLMQLSILQIMKEEDRRDLVITKDGEVFSG